MARHLHFRASQCVLAAVLLAASCVGSAADFGWVRQRPGTPPPEIRALIPEWQNAMTVPDRTALARRPFHGEIVKAAERAGIDPALVHAVIRVESGYNARAVSPKGAMGLMQVMPGTARRFGVDDPQQPDASISAGTQYLSHLMRLFGGDLRLALAAYNAGENAVIRHGRQIPPYRETRGYVPRVLDIYRALSALPPVTSTAPTNVVEAALAAQ